MAERVPNAGTALLNRAEVGGKISDGLFFVPAGHRVGAEGEEEQQEVQTELSSCSPLSPEKPGKKKVSSPSNYRAWQGLRLK